jgi:hypothetical protein
VGAEVTRQPRPVAPGALNAEGPDLTQTAGPRKERPVALRRCGDRDLPEPSTELVLGSSDVEVLVGVHTHDDAARSAMCHARCRHHPPPIRGSEVADRPGGWTALRWGLKPGSYQVTTRPVGPLWRSRTRNDRSEARHEASHKGSQAQATIAASIIAVTKRHPGRLRLEAVPAEA